MKIIFVVVALLYLPYLAAAQTSPPVPRRQPKLTDAVVTKSVEPQYTEEAQRAGLQGSVFLYISVSATGELERASIIQSLGLGLDEKALQAVRQWHFQPATSDGVPIRVEQLAEIRFVLHPAEKWSVTRAGYHVEIKDKWAREVTKPILRQYVVPQEQPCLSGGRGVIATVRIDKSGRPVRVAVVEERGDSDSALVASAIKNWRFQPASADGKRREATMRIEMHCQEQPEEKTSRNTDPSPEPIVEGVSTPKIVYKIEPDYSEEARRAKYQGNTVLQVTVDASGHINHARVIRSLGLGLDEKAVEAVSQWLFQPAVKNGTPVPVMAVIAVRFRLL